MIVALQLNHCGTDLDEVFRIARRAGIDKKGSREVCECWDMLQIWRDWGDRNFGELKTVRHRSPPDDPPDMELVFADQTVTFEHTRLQPHPLGWAEAVKHTQFPNDYTAVPAISNPPKNREELLHTLFSVLDAPWTDVIDEWKSESE